MCGILTDRAAELFTNSTLVRFRRIGCAHQVSPGLHRAFLLERHDDARAARHEFRQTLVKRFAAMNFIEAFGLLTCLMNHLHPPNAKAASDNAIDNLSGVTRAYGVGLNDCES